MGKYRLPEHKYVPLILKRYGEVKQYALEKGDSFFREATEEFLKTCYSFKGQGINDEMKALLKGLNAAEDFCGKKRTTLSDLEKKM